MEVPADLRAPKVQSQSLTNELDTELPHCHQREEMCSCPGCHSLALLCRVMSDDREEEEYQREGVSVKASA